MLCLKIAGGAANSVDPGEMLHVVAFHRVYTVCLGLSARMHMVKYGKNHAQTESQTDKNMTKSSVITNRLSITIAGLITDYLFSSD